MHEGLEDAVDAGLGDLGLLVDVFEGDGLVALLQQLKYVERLGENWNQIEPLDLCLGQSFVPSSAFPKKRRFQYRIASFSGVAVDGGVTIAAFQGYALDVAAGAQGGKWVGGEPTRF